MATAAERDRFLRSAADRAATDPISVKVRDLIGYWNAKSRGYRVVDRIQRDLSKKDLITNPDFASTHLSSHVHLVPAPTDGNAVDLDSSTEIELRVSSLSAAVNGVVSVNPDEPISRAYTEMALNDYSQLAVMPSERSLTGYVSWESIGLANLAHEPVRVRECTLPARTVDLNDPLLPLLAEIADKNFVFVRARDKTLSGIITASDITLEFGDVARPYLLVGEIERRLRRVADSDFSKEDIAAVANGGDKRKIESAEDLTMGQLARLFQSQDHWDQLGWRLDRATFTKSLDDVRQFRNRLMHFDEEPPTADELAMLDAFSRTVKLLARPPK